MDIKSPAVGKVLRLSVESGAQVARGDEVMVIESMKVEIPIKAPANGRIAEFRVKPGDQIQRNFILAVLDALPPARSVSVGNALAPLPHFSQNVTCSAGLRSGRAHRPFG